MAFEVHPLTLERFDDFADVVNPNRRSTHCWCLSHRLSAPQMRELGETREDAMRALAARDVAPGVEAHPVDNRPDGGGAASGTDAPDRIDTTMAFAGTWSMFDRAGFEVVGETAAKGSGRPRLVMRRDC